MVDSYLGSKVSYQYSVKVWKKKMFLTLAGKYVGHSFASFALLIDSNPYSCQI